MLVKLNSAIHRSVPFHAVELGKSDWNSAFSLDQKCYIVRPVINITYIFVPERYKILFVFITKIIYRSFFMSLLNTNLDDVYYAIDFCQISYEFLHFFLL